MTVLVTCTCRDNEFCVYHSLAAQVEYLFPSYLYNTSWDEWTSIAFYIPPGFELWKMNWEGQQHSRNKGVGGLGVTMEWTEELGGVKPPTPSQFEPCILLTAEQTYNIHTILYSDIFIGNFKVSTYLFLLFCLNCVNLFPACLVFVSAILQVLGYMM